MLICNEDDTYIAGALDAIFILQHTKTGRYHAALFLERLFPGPVLPSSKVEGVRLVSHGHHTEGSDTLEGVQVHFVASASVQPPPPKSAPNPAAAATTSPIEDDARLRFSLLELV